MKNKIYIWLLMAPFFITAQTYLHPTTGMQNQNVGACMISTCSGTYYDNGGVGGSTTTSNVAGNYSNNIGGIYQTFCPNAANMCIRAAFTQFSIEGGVGCPYDYFIINNGADQNSPTLVGACGTGALGTWTSSSPSGCLTFRFWSDGVVNRAGWAATLSCVACAGPNGIDNNDCSRATQICTNTTFNGASTGPGLISEGCINGATTAVDCNLSENETNWYSFQIATSGNLVLTITPLNGSDDYDFVLYGPGVTCGTLGSPIRCSYACYDGSLFCAPGAPTGMNTANDFVQAGAAEDVGGDGWVSTLPVTAGQIYYLMINKWSAGGAGYNIDWNGSTANFTCGGVLPIELLSFDAEFKGKKVDLKWTTQTELRSDYFTVEKSTDGVNFSAIGKVKAAGYSLMARDYLFEDKNFTTGTVYYRLRSTDIDGTSKLSDVNAVYINLFEDFFFVHSEPGLNHAQVFFNNAENDRNVTVTLYNSQGKIISNEAIITEPGTNEYQIDLNKLDKGIYFVTLYREGKIHTGKFIRY